MIITELIKELMNQQNVDIDTMIEITGLSHWIVEDILVWGVTPTTKQTKIMLGVLGVKLDDVLRLY